MIAIHPTALRKPINVGLSTLKEHIIAVWDTRTPGDRPGCWHISIPKEWVSGDIYTLKEGETLVGELEFKPRQGVKEEPRTSVKYLVSPDPVISADVIIFSAESLGKDRSSEEDYEVIAIRGLLNKPNPRPLNTLLHNIFNQSGGTPVEGSAEEKLKMIEESFLFWKDKVMVK